MKRIFCDLCKKEITDEKYRKLLVRVCGIIGKEYTRELCEGCFEKAFEDVYDGIIKIEMDRKNRKNNKNDI